MGYMIAYRKSPEDPARYLHEREHHLASFTAEAILLEEYELLSIQLTADSYPLTVAQVRARHGAKAWYREQYRKMRQDDPYAREEAYIVERFRGANPN